MDGFIYTDFCRINKKAFLRAAPIVPLVEPSFPVESEASYFTREEKTNACTRSTACLSKTKLKGSIAVVVNATVSTLSTSNDLQYSTAIITAGLKFCLVLLRGVLLCRHPCLHRYVLYFDAVIFVFILIGAIMSPACELRPRSTTSNYDARPWFELGFN